MQNHVKTKHQESQETKYNCSSCEFTTNFVGNLWQHMFLKHPGSKQLEFSPKSVKDAVLNLLAEQNMDLMEELVNMKRDLKNAFE